MGYKPKKKGYRLRFEDPDMDGLVVDVRGLKTGPYLEFQAARATREAGGTAAQGATELMLQMFADAIIEWNLDGDDDQPLPPTMDGLKTLDLDFTMDIINAWMDAINGVSAPLPQTSTDGSTSVEASIPMDVPSASLPS
ncbi:hypothetical protein [Kitasatospora griseola]|uniref:hypothetical protein n=1 Tax=Kitasatospora griseola TaxID=2064 RepID=UPI003664E3BB